MSIVNYDSRNEILSSSEIVLYDPELSSLEAKTASVMKSTFSNLQPPHHSLEPCTPRLSFESKKPSTPLGSARTSKETRSSPLYTFQKIPSESDYAIFSDIGALDLNEEKEDLSLLEVAQKTSSLRSQIIELSPEDVTVLLEETSYHDYLHNAKLLFNTSDVSISLKTRAYGTLTFRSLPFIYDEYGHLEHKPACGSFGRILFNEEHQLAVKIKLQKISKTEMIFPDDIEKDLEEGLFGLEIEQDPTPLLLGYNEVSYINPKDPLHPHIFFMISRKINHPDLFQKIAPPIQMMLHQFHTIEAAVAHSFTVFPLLNRVKVLKSAAQGCLFLHNKSIIHRDLKPENIFSNPDLSATIFDYGLSAKTHDTHRLGGSFAYLAPEAALEMLKDFSPAKLPPPLNGDLGKMQTRFPQTTKIDVFCLGITLDQCLNNSFAILQFNPNDKITSLKNRITSQIYVLPPRYKIGAPLSSVSRKIAHIVNSACALYPESRLDISQLIQEMTELEHLISETV